MEHFGNTKCVSFLGNQCNFEKVRDVIHVYQIARKVIQRQIIRFNVKQFLKCIFMVNIKALISIPDLNFCCHVEIQLTVKYIHLYLFSFVWKTYKEIFIIIVYVYEQLLLSMTHSHIQLLCQNSLQGYVIILFDSVNKCNFKIKML